MSAREDVVRIDLPATAEQLRLVRLVVASLATSHGADMDDLEDLRIATGELCAALVDAEDHGHRLLVEVSAGSSDERPVVRLRARNDGADAPAQLDELSAMVLDTTADQCGTGAAPWAQGDTDAGAWLQRSLHGQPAAVAERDDV